MLLCVLASGANRVLVTADSHQQPLGREAIGVVAIEPNASTRILISKKVVANCPMYQIPLE